jgi:hypothetical protein
MYRKVSHGRTMPARRSSKVSRVARGRLSALAILAAEIIEHYSNFVVLLSPLPHKCRHMSFFEWYYCRHAYSVVVTSPPFFWRHDYHKKCYFGDMSVEVGTNVRSRPLLKLELLKNYYHY